MDLLERGPKDLVLSSTDCTHKEQLGGKIKFTCTVQPKHAKQRKPTQSKLHMTQGRQRSLQWYRCQRYGHRPSEYPTKVSHAKDQKRWTPVGESNQKKTCAMVAKSHEDSEEAFTCVNVERPRSIGNSKKRKLNVLKPEMSRYYTVLLACPE